MSGTQTMQSTLRRIARPHPRIHQQCRTFTSTRRNPRSYGVASMARSHVVSQMGKEKTMQSKIREASGADVPDDLGFIPDTIVKPVGKELPSFLSRKYMKRVRIEWAYFQQKARDFFSMVYQGKHNVRRDPITRKKIREDLELANRYYEARYLHQKLYQAFANGQQNQISHIACTGVQSAMRAQLDRRRAINAPDQTWSIKYKGWTSSEKWGGIWLMEALIPPMFKSTRIMVDRTVPTGIGKDGTMRQVVVKIRGDQTLDKNDGTGPKTKYVEEYVVIQKMKIEGESGTWMIWGTTQPCTEKEMDEILSNTKASQGSIMDRLETARLDMRS